MPTDEPLPGVEIEEIPSGVHTIEGVSTSTALFIGRTEKGSLHKPVLCESLQDFEEEFSPTFAGGDLARGVRLFFANGGTRCFVLRLAPDDGQALQLADYEEAFELVDREVDLFNLLILPSDKDQDASARTRLWARASAFCRRRRAMLLLDPPAGWDSVAAVLEGVLALRDELALEHCALYYPQVLLAENGEVVTAGPSGALAGLIGRIDGTRGVWKAPAGPEADLRGIAGLTQVLSEEDHGRLNASGINVLKKISGGLVSWGARTLAGNDQYSGDFKYLPVKRIALFLEESLHRGLQWTVFEPNDEPLWAKIRLNAGAFLHTLFRQGAFQGSAPAQAYFVRCDAGTTSALDRAQGRVNLQVGFAPLRAAEFVPLCLQLQSGAPA